MRNQSSDEIYIYVLQLENGKYYVGQTNDLERRFRNHLSETKGAAWTRIHKPIRILRKFRTGLNDPNLALKFENDHTLQTIVEFGWQNVRGGDFINADLEEHHLHLILGSNLGNCICPIDVKEGIDTSKKERCVFTLELAEKKYFVGTTNNINLAILGELNGRGAEWTKQFKPQRLIRMRNLKHNYEYASVHAEELKRAFLMYPCQDVRGGRFGLIHEESHWKMVNEFIQLV